VVVLEPVQAQALELARELGQAQALGLEPGLGLAPELGLELVREPHKQKPSIHSLVPPP